MPPKKKPAPLPALGNGLVLSSSQVGTLLYDAFTPLMLEEEPEHRIIISDNQYESISVDFIRTAVLTDALLSPQAYQNDLFDCDDYVFFLKAKLSLYAASNALTAPLAVGCLLTVEHAFSFCIDQDQNLHLFNTQSDDRLSTADPLAFSAFLKLSDLNPIQLIYV